MHAKLLSRVWLLGTLWSVALQPPLSMGFSRQEYWGGTSFSRGSSQRRNRTHITLHLLCWQADSLPQGPLDSNSNDGIKTGKKKKRKKEILTLHLSGHNDLGWCHIPGTWLAWVPSLEYPGAEGDRSMGQAVCLQNGPGVPVVLSRMPNLQIQVE